MIGTIVLAAAATMADAMSHGKRATEQMSRSATYLAQLHTRLADLIMRAESIASRDGGVLLTCPDGQTAQLYTDDTQRIVIDEYGVYAYLSDPVQKGVTISAADTNRVVITVDMDEDGRIKTYTMTVARRAGRD